MKKKYELNKDFSFFSTLNLKKTMMRRFGLFFTLSLAFLFFYSTIWDGLADQFIEKPMPSVMKKKRAISIMTMNMENMFDNEHDPGKLDFTYLPLAKKTPEIKRLCRKNKACLFEDWNEAKVRKKLENLAAAIVHNGRPDIILMQEVENIKILQRMQRTYLKDYTEEILVEGDDRRGIDVAILSKLPLVEPARIHTIPYVPQKDSRPILEATFRLPDGQLMTVFAFHFPSQGMKKEYRAYAVETLRKLMLQKPDNTLVIAGGDSNITAKEYDLWTQYGSGLTTTVSLGVRGGKGTHYYKGEWSLLDVILFKSNMINGKAPWQYIKNSAEIANKYYRQYKMIKGQKIPRAYRFPKYDGVADHFPLKVVIYKK